MLIRNFTLTLKRAGYVLLLLAAMAPLLYRYLSPTILPDFLPGNTTSLNRNQASMTMSYACKDCIAPSVHAANVIEKLDGGLFATWFGGSGEGNKDVVLWGSDFSQDSQSWSLPRRIIGPPETQAALGRYIKTIGNSVLVRGKQGELWLYYVTVAVGGWAGSSLNAILSLDDGKSWNAPRRLISSPFFNISTLNKNAAVYYSNGTVGLPVYHEFFGKFAELLLIDKAGQIVGKARITHGRHSIQPLVLPIGPQQALALMRDTGPWPGRVLASRSDDTGQSWSKETRLELSNPNSSITGLRRPDGSLLLVFNDTESNRNSLALAVSRDDGRSWHTIKHFEKSDDRNSEFSYPYLIRCSDGTMHLLYTWNHTRIRHIAFNDNFVDGSMP